jgi:hypothetical protein
VVYDPWQEHEWVRQHYNSQSLTNQQTNKTPLTPLFQLVWEECYKFNFLEENWKEYVNVCREREKRRDLDVCVIIYISVCIMWKFILSIFVKTNVFCLFTETTTTNHKTVFSDKTMMITTGSTSKETCQQHRTNSPSHSKESSRVESNWIESNWVECGRIELTSDDTLFRTSEDAYSKD